MPIQDELLKGGNDLSGLKLAIRHVAESDVLVRLASQLLNSDVSIAGECRNVGKTEETAERD